MLIIMMPNAVRCLMACLIGLLSCFSGFVQSRIQCIQSRLLSLSFQRWKRTRNLSSRTKRDFGFDHHFFAFLLLFTFGDRRIKMSYPKLRINLAASYNFGYRSAAIIRGWAKPFCNKFPPKFGIDKDPLLWCPEIEACQSYLVVVAFWELNF